MSRRTSLVGLGIGLAAAGVGAAVGLAAERLAVGRPVVRRFPTDDDDIPLGSLREVPVMVTADDGTLLHAEIDEPAPAERGHDLDGQADGADPLTVIFCHGYALNLDSWHFQRVSLQGRVRCVYWDHRGHGRSERGESLTANIPQLGGDLNEVIKATAPRGPLVLIGHSMGGMTIMSFASQFPDIVAARVVGVGLIATSSGDLARADLGLDKFGYLIRRLAPRALSLLAHQPGLVEKTRRIGSDLEEVIVKRWSYASDVDEVLVDFTARMIAATQLEVVGDFLPQFNKHDEAEALSYLRGKEALVLTGDSDLMIPPEHSIVLSEALPGCEYALVKEAGHLVMLEHPDIVTPHVVSLIHRAGKAAGERDRQVTARPVRPRRRTRSTSTAVKPGREAKAARGTTTARPASTDPEATQGKTGRGTGSRSGQERRRAR